MGRKDLVDMLVPENNSWKSDKPKDVKNTFDDAIPSNNSRPKNKYKSRKKRR